MGDKYLIKSGINKGDYIILDPPEDFKINQEVVIE